MPAERLKITLQEAAQYPNEAKALLQKYRMANPKSNDDDLTWEFMWIYTRGNNVSVSLRAFNSRWRWAIPLKCVPPQVQKKVDAVAPPPPSTPEEEVLIIERTSVMMPNKVIIPPIDEREGWFG